MLPYQLYVLYSYFYIYIVVYKLVSLIANQFPGKDILNRIDIKLKKIAAYIVTRFVALDVFYIC